MPSGIASSRKRLLSKPAMTNCFSLLGTLALEGKTWVMKGVVYLQSTSEGSNFYVTSNNLSDDSGKASSPNLPSCLSLSGSILPLNRLSNEAPETISLDIKSLEDSCRVQVSVRTPLSDISVLSGFAIESANVWDISVHGEIRIPEDEHHFRRRSSWHQGLGKGKRIRISGFQSTVPEPIFVSYDHVTKDKVKVTWEVPVALEGEVVWMDIYLKASSGQKIEIPTNENCQLSTVYPQHVGRKTVEKNLLRIELAPTALRRDSNCDEEDELHTFYTKSTHSVILDDLGVGEYQVCVLVRQFPNTDDVTDQAELSFLHFPPFYVHLPPDPPSDLNVMVQKMKSSKSDEVICEPFAIISWKGPEQVKPLDLLSNNFNRGGPADGFSVALEVYNVKLRKWQPFGEPMIVKPICSWSVDYKETCVLEALPEVFKNSKTDIISKFRVLVRSVSRFGTSEALYSGDLEVPTFDIIESSKTIDFCNVNEATCVICSEPINFDAKRNEVFRKQLKRGYSRSSEGLEEIGLLNPLRGVFKLEENLFECPVTPLCCSHLFHVKCLLDWAKSSRKLAGRSRRMVSLASKCPLCMQPFFYVSTQELNQNKQQSRDLLCATSEIIKVTPEAKPVVPVVAGGWFGFGKRPAVG